VAEVPGTMAVRQSLVKSLGGAAVQLGSEKRNLERMALPLAAQGFRAIICRGGF